MPSNITLRKNNETEFLDEIWYKIKEYMISNTNYFEIFNTICYHIYQPYEFSDHKNKTFENQYEFIKRHPALIKDINDKLVRKMVTKAIAYAREIYN